MTSERARICEVYQYVFTCRSLQIFGAGLAISVMGYIERVHFWKLVVKQVFEATDLLLLFFARLEWDPLLKL